MRRILFFTRPLTPPWDEASKNLAFDLSQNLEGDFELEILTTKTFAEKITTENHLKEKYFAQVNPNSIFSSPRLNFWTKIKLLRRLFQRNINADIVHFLFTPRSLTSFLFRLRFKFSKSKTLLTMATFSSNQGNLTGNKKEQYKKLKKIFFFDQIITQSKYSEKKLRNFGFKNVQTIYPGIDLEKFSPQPQNQTTLKSLNLASTDEIILFAGEYLRLGEKVVDEIIEAFVLLNKSFRNQKLENKSLKLVLAIRIKSKKDKLKKQQLLTKIKKLSCAKQIIFLDFFNQMPELYNLSRVNIFPAHKMEGKFDIPYAVLEPMACAKPMIVSNLPVLTEFVKNEETGLVIDSGNVTALQKAIEQLLKDKALTEKLGQNARQYVEENFDIKSAVKKYAKVYNKL